MCLFVPCRSSVARRGSQSSEHKALQRPFSIAVLRFPTPKSAPAMHTAENNEELCGHCGVSQGHAQCVYCGASVYVRECVCV